MRLVSCKMLGEWLGFSVDTLRKWVKLGKLDEHFVNGALHHSVPSINALLAHVSNEVQPLTVEDFRNGARLIPTRQTAAILTIAPSSVISKLHRHRFRGFNFEGNWRFLEETVWSYKARRENYFTRTDVMRIFGCSTRVIYRWENEGVLEAVQVSGGGQWRYFYTPQDVLRTVKMCLPTSAKHRAQEWLDEALASKQPPCSSLKAMEYLGITYVALKSLQKNGDIFYLLLANGRDARYSQASLRHALIAQKAWTPQELGHVIGGEPVQINRWLAGPLACKLHDHNDLEYRYVCLVAVLPPLLSPGLTPRMWLGRRTDRHPPLIPIDAAAKHFDVSTSHLALLAEAGAIGGLRRPDGVWMFTPSRLARYSQAKMRQLVADLP
jgi:hypothetical protein